jgi:thiol-disulfide isomerase/thioredoxin
MLAIVLASAVALVSPGGAAATPATPLETEFKKAVDAFMVEYRAADAQARQALLDDPAREPRHRFTPLFLAEAKKRQGTREALPLWAWLVENGTIVDRPTGEHAVERLLADHLSDPDLASGARAIGRVAGIRGEEKTVEDLTRIIAGSRDSAVRAEAFFQRGFVRRDSNLPLARGDFEWAVKEDGDSPAGKRAAEALAATAPLKAGEKAPDFSGSTLSSTTVKLSELRGRVLLVDFWGMWCGPCVAQIPGLRKLHDRYAGKPFDIVGIDTDRDVEALRKFAAVNHIDWITVTDGGTDGPVGKGWRVDAWPTSFLVDREGIIRGRDLPPEALEERIESLLAGR